MTPQEALDRITALCDEAETNRWNYPHDNGLSPLATYKLRAVLAEVSPEPGGELQTGSKPGLELQFGGVLDRDQAGKVLWEVWDGGRCDEDPPGEQELDRLAGCVRPAAIDRDALMQALAVHRWKDMGVDWCSCECGMVLRGDGTVTAFPADEAFRGHIADVVLALMRPVAGVTLTPEEARLARDWFSLMAEDVTPDAADAARLGAAS